MVENVNTIWKTYNSVTSSEDIKDLMRQGYRYACSLTHNPAHAEDLLHDAWIAVLNANGPQNKPYLFTSIRNLFLNQHKREKLVPFVSFDEIINETELQSDESDEPTLFANREELNSALKHLRAIEREIIFLYYIESYSTQEVADHTGLGKGTVCSLIFRARNKLKTHLSQQAVKVAT